MRTLTSPAQAAVAAVVTSPGHLVELSFDPTPARWSDIGSVRLPDGRIFEGVDMRIQSLAFIGDAAPAGFSVQLGNLDSAVGALVLANDIAGVTLSVWGCDRRALDTADIVPLGTWSITNARVGIDAVTIACAPIFYTAPFRRVDAANGFLHATPEGTQIVWGADRITLTRDGSGGYG